MDFFLRLIADYLVIVIAVIGVFALFFFVPKGHRYQAYCRALLAGLTALLLAKLLAAVWQPTALRPYELLGINPGASYLDNPGFPSDHMLFVTAIVLAVWFETRRKLLSICLAILAILVGVGRVVTLVHTPLDVIGGALVAAIGGLWYLQRTHPAQLAKRKRIS